MIECPICHIVNDEEARYCAECGQRLGIPVGSFGGAQQGEDVGNSVSFEQPGTSVLGSSSSASSVSGGNEAETAVSSTNISAVSAHASEATTQSDSGAHVIKLHSPIFGNDELIEDPNMSENSAPRRRTGLHSPLLGDDQYEDNAYEPPYQAAGQAKMGQAKTGQTKKGLHSPLLGNTEYEDDYEDSAPGSSGQGSSGQGSSRGLHSPLLGPSVHHPSAFDSAQFRPSNKNADAKKSHLRSPLLDDAFDDDDFSESVVDSSPNPNALRSPLLESRVSLPEPKEPEYPLANALTKAGLGDKATPKPGADTDAGLGDKANIANQTSSYGSLPGQEMPQSVLGSSGSYTMPAAASGSRPLSDTAYGAAPETNASSISSTSQSASQQISSQNLSGQKSQWGDLSSLRPGAQQAASAPEEQVVSGTRPGALRSRMFGGGQELDENASSAAPTARGSQYSGATSHSSAGTDGLALVAKIFVVPLAIGAGAKLLLFKEYIDARQFAGFFMVDQICQLIALLFLIFIALTYSSKKSS